MIGKIWIIAALACGSFFLKGNAQVRLPSLIAGNMVLQQQSEATIWGWAAPGEAVSVNGSWSTDTVKAVADGQAHWQLKLKTPAAGGPYTVTIKASNTIRLNDVLIGEVWICAGQSNMEWSASRGIKDAQEELSHADNNKIRFFTVAKNGAAAEQQSCDGDWKICNAQSLNTFSAVGYFYGKRLQQNLNVPVGLINITWEGTAAESWTPDSLVENQPQIAAHTYQTRAPDFAKWPTATGVIYNGMVYPVKNVTVAGVIWYQGESNAGYPQTYGRLFKMMIESWRSLFKKELPFYYVQIAPFKNYGAQDTAYLVREQQVKSLAIPNTGMVVTTDLAGDGTQIHPPYKAEVGKRLANYALAETYHRAGVAYKSPLYKKMEIRGNTIVVYFDNAEKGLKCKGDSLTEFTIAGADHHFYSAKARIDKNTVIVYAKEVPKPTTVRFAFSNGPLPNLFGKEGLPVSPFRTDDEN